MNRTVVIFFGLTLLIQGAITQTEATAQFRASSRRNLIHRVKAGTPVESEVGIQLEAPKQKPIADWPPVLEGEQDVEPNEVERPSPRAVLDLSTTGRIPKQTDAGEATSEVDQVNERAIKVVELKSDQFYHRTVPFEEPLHERFGISHPPAVQLSKSTLGFFGKSLLLPANLLPRRHSERDCDSNQGWRETQGRQACPQCE